MTDLSANSLLPFVPSGKDYEASRRLFKDLGFEEVWENISRKGLDRTYPGVRFSGPTDHPWGREVNLIDLAGVCWHIGQRAGS